MDKFEYKIINISRTQLKETAFQTQVMEKFNLLGAEGWELITAEGLNEGSVFWRVSETVDILFMFKRKLVVG